MRAHPNTRVRIALQRRLAADAERLVAHWDDALGGDPEAVRRVRIASRRLRQALAVIARVRTLRAAEASARTLGIIGRTFGPLRDTAMTAALLASGEALPELEGATRELRADLDRELRARVASARRRTRSVSARRLAERLASISADMDTAAATTSWATALTVLVAARTTAVSDAARACGTLYEPERLHALRLAIKKLRYVTELAADASLVPRSIPARLARHQQHLGAWHDRVIALELMRERDARDGPRASWARLEEMLERDARVRHGQIVGKLGALARVVDDVRGRLAGLARGSRGTPMRASLPRVRSVKRVG